MAGCPACKVAIDCSGYRKEMDNAVDLIIANIIKDDDAVNAFIALQEQQESLWLAWRNQYGDINN